MSARMDDFYRGRRVFVTGHTGFKGGWLVTWLKALGAEVTGLSLPPEQEDTRFFRDARVGEDMCSLAGDVRDPDLVLRAIRDAEPEVVFHLAAQSLVRRSYRDPVGTYATNLMGTVHVLDAVRRVGSVGAAVIVTTDKCYENREWVWGYREHEPMGGHDPYSSSKGCAELATAAFRRSFFPADRGVGIASARAGNVVGGGDWSEDRLVPDIMRALLAGRPVPIRNPHAWRPWQHVLEPVAGYLRLGALLYQHPTEFAEAWNFGPAPEDTVTVLEMAERFIACWGSGQIALASEANAPHEARALTLDASKARARLGWRPRLSLSELTELTVEWYRAWGADPGTAAALTWTQIEHYRGLLAGPSAAARPAGEPVVAARSG